MLENKSTNNIFSTKYALHVFLITLAISVLAFFSQVLVARNMSQKNFATYAAVGALINISGVLFSSIFLNQVKLIKTHVGELNTKFFDRGTLGLLVIALSLSTVFQIAIAVQNTGTPGMTVFLAGLIFPMVALVSGLNAKLQGLGKLRSLNFSTFVTILISVIAISVLISAGALTVNSALLVTLLSNVFTVFVFSIKLPPSGLASTSLFSAGTFKLALISSGYWFFVQADILFSPLWLAESERGEYSAASSVAKILLIACGVINGLLLNSLLNHKRDGGQFPLKLLFKYLLVESFMVMVFLVCVHFIGDTAFQYVFGSHLASESGFLLQICLTGIPLVLAGIVVQALVSYSDSWIPGIVLWSISIAFFGIGGLAIEKIDLVNFYAWGGGVMVSLLLITALRVYRKQGRG
jgi:O-antigen/teichoic acid export membrane protein